MAQDIVCGMEVDEATAAGKIVYKGSLYFFCAPGCLSAFLGEPDKYLNALKIEGQPGASNAEGRENRH